MTTVEAISLLKNAVQPEHTSWADIGAGTGTFTLALREIMTAGTIFAVDKSPHALWSLPLNGEVKIQIVEGDFTKKMELPTVDNILMANALHYAEDPLFVLKNVLTHLRPGGTFLLIEYETDTPLQPWIPHPVPLALFQKTAAECGLAGPVEIGRAPTQYGHQHIYAAVAKRAK